MSTAEAPVRMELMLCTDTLLAEIANPECTRRDIAQTYALAIRSTETKDWPRINSAIMERWSVAGLLWIKTQAWSGRAFRPPMKKRRAVPQTETRPKRKRIKKMETPRPACSVVGDGSRSKCEQARPARLSAVKSPVQIPAAWASEPQTDGVKLVLATFGWVTGRAADHGGTREGRS